MKLSELVEHCSFHDDTLKDIRYNPETKTAEFEIVFSNYEMESFTGRKEEILIIKLVFTDVSFLDCSRYVKRTDYEDYVFSTDLIHNQKTKRDLVFICSMTYMFLMDIIFVYLLRMLNLLYWG